MNLKTLLLTLTALSIVSMATTHAQAEIEHVVLKNPSFTDELKIKIDTSNQTLSLEKCTLNFVENANRCQKVGESVTLIQLNRVGEELDRRGNAIVGGAVLSTITFVLAYTFCITKGKCKFLERFAGANGSRIERLDPAALVVGIAGGTLGGYVFQTSASQVKAVIQLQEAVDQALARDDKETGDLVIETQASLKEIVESFSLLQLLIQQNEF